MTILFNNAYNVFTTLSTFADQKLPIKLSYKIMKIMTNLEGEIEFYRNRLQQLLDECALKNDNGVMITTNDGNGVEIKPDKLEYFNNQYIELHEMPIEIDDFKFTLEELESLELSPKQLYTLQDFIVEETE